MKASTLLSTVAAGALALAFASSAMAQSSGQPPAKPAPAPTAKPAAQPTTTAQPAKKDEKKSASIVGQKATDFDLMDTEGKEFKLSSSSGKIVVLTWFNPDCPVVKNHYEANKTFIDLNKKYGDKVVFYAINSGAAGEQGSGKERNAKARKDWAMAFPILLDETGATGKAYGAKNTPAVAIVGADGNVAYFGAPDDGNPGSVGKTNYVAKALDELLASKPVTTKETKAYGCSIKYKN